MLFGWLLPAPQLMSQNFDATTLRQPTDLGVTWLVKAGDDPAYARTDFDDSHWMVVDSNKSLKSYFPNQHPSVMWYRLHIRVAPDEKGLALGEWNLSSAFEIYVNGQKLMQTGQVTPYVPSQFSARLLKQIPDADVATGSLVIAMRMHISPNEWVSPFPGYYPYNLSIGEDAALSDHVWLLTIGQNALGWFYECAGLGLGIIALALFTAQRRQREYLWIFLLFLGTAINAPFQFYMLFHNLPAWWAYVNGCLNIAGMVFETLVFLAFLRMSVARWIQIILALAAVGLLYGSWQTASGNGSPLGILLSVTPELSLLAGIIPLLLIVHARRGNREAGILLVPALVLSLSIYIQLGIFLVSLVPAFAVAAQQFLNAVFNWTVGPFTVNVGDAHRRAAGAY